MTAPLPARKEDCLVPAGRSGSYRVHQLKLVPVPSSSGSQPAQDSGTAKYKMADSLFKAVSTCHFSTVRFLLNNGISSKVTKQQQHNLLITALRIEDEKKRDVMFRYLLKRGADGCFTDKVTGRDVLTWASLMGRTEQVRHLLEEAVGEVNPSARDREGMTALHHATINGHLEVVLLLIGIMNRFQLPIDVTDKRGLTPYIYARRLGFLDIADLLLTEGHCSPKQFDNLVHKSVEDWIKIGIQERKDKAKQCRRDVLEQFKISGKVLSNAIRKDSVATPRVKLPALTLSKCDPSCTTQQGANHQPLVQKTSRSNTLLSDGFQHAKSRGPYALYTPAESQLRRECSDIYSDRTKCSSSRRFGGVADPRHLQLGGRTASDIRLHRYPHCTGNLQSKKAADTAFTLLGMQESSEYTHAAEFVPSVIDPEKARQASGVIGDINSIMDILSQQQSSSFRRTKKILTPPTSLPRRKGRRTKASTLAVLFGKSKVIQPQQRAIHGNIPKTMARCKENG